VTDNLLPPLDPFDLAKLRESIGLHGVREAIIVDEFGKVIDGHHRKQIADELGVVCPERTVTGLTEPEKYEYAITHNAARRQLTIEQRREVWGRHRAMISAALTADPRRSDRSIAEETGASRPTVAAIREELEENGRVAILERRGRGEPVEREPQAINVADHRNEVWFDLTLGYPCESDQIRKRADDPYPQESDRLTWPSGRQYLIADAARTLAEQDAIVDEVAARAKRELRLHPMKTVAMALR
jgi:DNA-binding Lrp family transcriptional regulator